MDWRVECQVLAEEIREDLLRWGDCLSLAIYEMQPFTMTDGRWGVFRALVSYDTEPSDIEMLKKKPCYAGCEFETMMLSDVLKIALHQGK